MATQIFIEPELENLADNDTAAEWFELASELGLNKQVSLADKSEVKQAPAYMAVDPKTKNIMQVLCPRTVDYADYGASTIPLDVLQEIQKCVKNGWYKSIKIMYDDKTPDPFVIGEYCDTQHSWITHTHLIARWGAELVPFEQLEHNAIARMKDEAKVALMEIQGKINIALQDVEVFCKGLLGGKDAPRMSFSPTVSSSLLPF